MANIQAEQTYYALAEGWQVIPVESKESRDELCQYFEWRPLANDDPKVIEYVRRQVEQNR